MHMHNTHTHARTHTHTHTHTHKQLYDPMVNYDSGSGDEDFELNSNNVRISHTYIHLSPGSVYLPSSDYTVNGSHCFPYLRYLFSYS